MTVGIPKALLYYKYHVFARTFFETLGARVVVSPDTNKQILNAGALLCADEACLPVKVLHGHAEWLKSRCDALLLPRFMRMEKGKSICPMFCGLPDMVRAAINGLPPLIDAPVWSLSEPEQWALAAAKGLAGRDQITAAVWAAVRAQRAQAAVRDHTAAPHRVALIGHAYNLGDRYINMDLLRKLARLGVGAVTADDVAEEDIAREAGKLFKAPFWYFARRYYGAAAHLCAARKVEGVLYVSAFSCGVDSVVAELAGQAACGLPFMELKLDEHTGAAGFDTRLEAFADMLERRSHGRHIPADGQHLACRQSVL